MYQGGNVLEKILRITLLFDFYGELLTDKQKDIFSLHYLNDFSLNEIAVQYGITRQAVMDMVKRTEKILEGYEQKLMLVDRYIKQKEKLYKTWAYISSLYDLDKNDQLREMFFGILD